MKSRKAVRTAWPEHVRAWLTEPATAEIRRAIGRLARAEDVHRIAVMPDVHLAGEVCVGSVVATRTLVYPQAVGSDIGCGMAALAFNAEADVLRDEQAGLAVLHGLGETVPVLRHRSCRAAPALPDELVREPLSDLGLQSFVERDGRVEFGTLGRGNHFMEFQTDGGGRLWLMVHGGSRAPGQRITEWHSRSAVRAAGGLVHIDGNSPAGQAYLADVAWARRYADLNRRWMLRAVCGLIHRLFGVEADWDSLIVCDHNHVQREEHNGQSVWVHRKGANIALDGEPGIIPGSMGTCSFQVTGRGCAAALRSSSHGAGRRLGRREARQQVTARQLAHELGTVWFDQRFSDALREEAPSAYKDIETVMRAQRELVRVTRRLRPLLVYKGA